MMTNAPNTSADATPANTPANTPAGTSRGESASLSADQARVAQEEERALDLTLTAIRGDAARAALDDDDDLIAIDEELLALREQVQEARAEDQAALIEHMNRLAALQNARGARGEEVSAEELLSSPYFARIEYVEEDEDGEETGHTRVVMIGKRSFFSADGRVKVVDWRSSPMSKLYYTFREGDYFYEEIGARVVTGTLSVRRMLTIERSELKRIQFGRSGDQTLQRASNGEWRSGAQALTRLEGGEGVASRINLNPRKRGALPDITALIDPAQFSLITGERSGVVIIQGGAGTGKTTIALHRIAYLHFQNPKRFKPERCLIISPGEALKRYIEQSLPALDLAGIQVETLSVWGLRATKRLIPKLKRFKLHDATPAGAARIKRHPLILKLIEREVAREARAYDDLIEQIGGESLLDAWVKWRDLPVVERLKKTRELARAQRLLLDHRGARFEEMTLNLTDPRSTWVNLLSASDTIREAFQSAGEELYEWELKQLRESALEQNASRERFGHADQDYQVGVDHKALESSPLRERLDAEDCMILLRICQLKWGRLAGPQRSLSYEHITVDEAQDLAPISLRVLCDATPNGAPVTLAGDTAQRVIFDNGFHTWREALAFLPKRTQLLPPLMVSYRSTRQVMSLARALLGDLVHSWESRDSRDGAPVGFLSFPESGEGISFLGEALRRVMSLEPDATVAVVARDKTKAREYFEQLQRSNITKLRLVIAQDFPFTAGIDVTEVKQVKGLEYDYIIALDVDAESYPARDDARHLLHVVATRAAHQLWLMNIGPLSPSPLLPRELIETGELSEQPSEQPIR